jgi:hypothetical protein
MLTHLEFIQVRINMICVVLDTINLFYFLCAYFGDTHPAISVISTQCFY